MCPWEPIYPYRYYEEAPFQFAPRPIKQHLIWHDLDFLTRRVAVLEQKVSKIEQAHESKEEKKDAVRSD